jgi:CheY-like chemotaxis protein
VQVLLQSGRTGSFAPAVDGSTQTGGPPGRARVLYIEDSELSITVLEGVLAQRPTVDLVAAMDGSAGIEKARGVLPSLIILDLGLPDMPGIEVLEELRSAEETAKIPVIVLTADTDAQQEARLLEAGALAYLTKPMNEDLFLGLVDEVLSGR